MSTLEFIEYMDSIVPIDTNDTLRERKEKLNAIQTEILKYNPLTANLPETLFSVLVYISYTLGITAFPTLKPLIDAAIIGDWDKLYQLIKNSAFYVRYPRQTQEILKIVSAYEVK